ncbi:MAG TPA: efflux RND transporter periplasmic adaptor subunit [Hyphomicrobiaceae bacterium]|nr:efflux RND transporter periplasmic adaptor subunit [Hyphomicrobiaceae bacterium]
MRQTLRALAAWAAAAVLLLSAASCSRDESHEQKQAGDKATAEAAYVAAESEIDDLKAMLATVRSKKVVEARVRTPGTVAALHVTEGAHIEPGQVLGLVTDPKIALRLKASEAQIVALESRLATARSELDRTAELQKRGVAPQARLDQARTAFDVATNDLTAARSERAVIEKQAEEGQVLAPGSGRILRVPVTEGSVVLAGESIATIAASDYLLRLEVPERHARFMKKGDVLKIGHRGLGPDQQPAGEGRLVQVYPEIVQGRVIADADVSGLGDYFVGERTLVWISAGKRRGILIPRELTFRRFGLDYVRVALADQAVDVVVQLGQLASGEVNSRFVEVLAGVRPGDRLVRP